jgi:hypothetical protein
MAKFPLNRQKASGGVSSIAPVLSGSAPAGVDKRRGVRVNSCVPVALEWDGDGQVLRKEAKTRIVGPYGCMVVFPQHLEIDQKVNVTNLASSQTNTAVVVWRGHERPEGWELGIELINPNMDFWGFEL